MARVGERRTDRPQKPLIKSARLWVPVTLGVLLLAIIGIGVAGWQVAERGFAARDELERAIPLAKQAQEQIMAGDQEGAKATVDELAVHAAEARRLTDDPMWRSFEWVPVAGPNLEAVRVASTSVDELVEGVVRPATSLSLDALKPVDGAIDVAALTELAGVVDGVAATIDDVSAELDAVDREELIGPVADGIAQLDDAVGQIQPMLGPASTALDVLPAALGADGPRNYLLLFQNNAESRGSGGNPASLLLLNVTDGRVSIAQQASSSDFARQDRPIMELDPESVVLYGDKIGRYMQDVTITPDFTETSELIRAFWASEFGSQVDGVISFDPVALGYLLGATGPITLPTGEQLTAENAAPLLLNEVYFRYPEGDAQDAFFAAAAGSVFQVITSGAGETDALLEALTRAVDEGRLMYAPSDPAEAEFIAGTRITGTLPVDNAEQAMVGVYVNDVTEGKLDYYLQLDAAAASDQCTVDASTAPTFTTTATLTNTLQPDQVPGLADYISPARFFPKGDIATELVLYGPVGGTFQSAQIDGAPTAATPVSHLGRPAVKVFVQNTPGSTHTVSAVFTGPADAAYGPLELWHTPMVRPANVTIDAPGCDAEQSNAAG